MFLGLTDNAVSISWRALRSCIPSGDGAQTCCRRSWHVSGNDTWCFRIWSFLPLSLCSRQHCRGKLFGTNSVFLLQVSICLLSVFIVPFLVNVPAVLDRTSLDSAKLVVKRHQHKKSKSSSISCSSFSSSSCSSSKEPLKIIFTPFYWLILFVNVVLTCSVYHPVLIWLNYWASLESLCWFRLQTSWSDPKAGT